MLVLKTTSPKRSPRAPKPRPVYTVPSSRASLATVSAIKLLCPEQLSQFLSQRQVCHQQTEGEQRHREERQGAGDVVAVVGAHEQAEDGAGNGKEPLLACQH